MLHRLHAVRHPASLKMKGRRQQVFVTVAASDSHGRSRGHDARPNHVAIVNRVAQRNVRVVFRAEVAHGGKPRFERPPRVPRAMQRFARRGNFQSFIRERTQFKGQMRVHVDQTGQQRGIRQIDRRVSHSRFYLSGGRDLRNFVAFNHDRLIRAQLTRAHIQHTPRANYCPLRRLPLRDRRDCHSGQDHQNCHEARSPSADFRTCSCVRF